MLINAHFCFLTNRHPPAPCSSSSFLAISSLVLVATASALVTPVQSHFITSTTIAPTTGIDDTSSSLENYNSDLLVGVPTLRHQQTTSLWWPQYPFLSTRYHSKRHFFADGTMPLLIPTIYLHISIPSEEQSGGDFYEQYGYNVKADVFPSSSNNRPLIVDAPSSGTSNGGEEPRSWTTMTGIVVDLAAAGSAEQVIGRTAVVEERQPRNASLLPKISGPQMYPVERSVPTLIILGTLTTLTLIGNVLVIVAVATQQILRKTVVNRAIASLAVAGLLVSLFVMPISLLNEISKVWFLGDALCDAFVFLDVNFCTASILHLLAIAIDRYLSATKITYFRVRHIAINVMLACAWVIAAILSVLPLLGWRDPEQSASKTGICLVSGDPWFAVFGTTVAFYAPTALIVAVYVKVYVEVKKRIKQRMTASSLQTGLKLQTVAAQERQKSHNSKAMASGYKQQQPISLVSDDDRGHKNQSPPQLDMNTRTSVTTATNSPVTTPPMDSNRRSERLELMAKEGANHTITASTLITPASTEQRQQDVLAKKTDIRPIRKLAAADGAAGPMINLPRSDSNSSSLSAPRHGDLEADMASETGTVYDNLTDSEAQAMVKRRATEQTKHNSTVSTRGGLLAVDVATNKENVEAKKRLVSPRKRNKSVPSFPIDMTTGAAGTSSTSAAQPNAYHVSRMIWKKAAAQKGATQSAKERRDSGDRNRWSIFGGKQQANNKQRRLSERRVSVAMALMAVAVDQYDYAVPSIQLSEAPQLLQHGISYGAFTVKGAERGQRAKKPSSSSKKEKLSSLLLERLNNHDNNVSVVAEAGSKVISSVNFVGGPNRTVTLDTSAAADRTAMWKQREHKTAAILLIVTSAFIICWLPYFVLELATPLCRCEPYLPAHPLIRTAVTWLGYCNSLFNPIIYTVTSADFRIAFKTLLRFS